MRSDIVAHLIDPEDRQPLTLESSTASDDGHVETGILTRADGGWYPVVGGVPSFVVDEDLTDFCAQTGRDPERGLAARKKDLEADVDATFSDKWQRFPDYGMSPEHQQFLHAWYCKKLGFVDVEELREFYRGKDLILEVGPGSGFNARFLAESTAGQVFAVDISRAAHVCLQNTRSLDNCAVLRADLAHLPFADELFDLIIADGVLHHTPNTRESLRALWTKLRPGGALFFYVYKQMGAARGFSDRYLREQLSDLPPADCYDACRGLTELGRELSRLGVTVNLERGVPQLGIPPGAHDVQRLLYYSFVKCFWNEAFDFETNNMVNFDWYHPALAWQHTRDEVEGWLDELGVASRSFQDANPNGLSVLVTKS